MSREILLRTASHSILVTYGARQKENEVEDTTDYRLLPTWVPQIL